MGRDKQMMEGSKTAIKQISIGGIMKILSCSIILRLIVISSFFFMTMGCNCSKEKSSWQSAIKGSQKMTEEIITKTTEPAKAVVTYTKNTAKSLIGGKGKEIKPIGIVPSKDLNLIVDRGNISPESLARSLELQPRKEYCDYIDLGTCYVWTGNNQRAAEAYEMAAQVAQTETELGSALHNKAAILAYVNLDKALSCVTLASRILPDNLEIARLRLALYQKSSDQLGLVVANDHLASLDPSLSGQEVALHVAVYLAGIVCVTLFATTTSVYALTPPEDRKDIAKPIMDGFYNTMSSVAKTSLTIAQKIMETKI